MTPAGFPLSSIALEGINVQPASLQCAWEYSTITAAGDRWPVHLAVCNYAASAPEQRYGRKEAVQQCGPPLE
jgi:hypothetical protein